MCLKSKAARLIVLWCFLTFTGYYLSYGSTLHFLVQNLKVLENVSAQNIHFGRIVFLAFVQILYPLGGLLGDIKYGRYRIIKRSLIFLIFMSVMLSVIGSLDFVVLKHPGVFIHNKGTAITLGIFCFLVLLSVVGFVTFFANVLPFAMDQLRDAPAQESWLFIYWYMWTINTCFVLSQVIFSVLFNENGVFRFNLYNPVNIGTITYILNLTGASLMMFIAISVLVTLIVSLIILHRRQKWFNIEPCKVNPYKLVYRVTRFACQHKIPVRRSAFTYCEDELPSRLDLGKSKYGGPFTTEEVEDVKVFYGILKVLLSLGPVFYFALIGDTALSLGIHMSNDAPTNSSTGLTNFDFGRILVLCNGMLSPLLAVVTVPLCICFSRHFKSCSLHILGSLRRIEIATLMILLNTLFMLGVNIASHVRDEDLNCMFQLTGDDSPIFTPLQMASMLIIQQGLAGTSRILLDISTFEFLCAQSPHPMKGMLIGLAYAIQGIIVLLGLIIQTPFIYWPYSFPSCGFIYYSMNVVIGVISFVTLARIVNGYKFRERDEPSRERQFAEEYYSKTQPDIQHNSYYDSLSTF